MVYVRLEQDWTDAGGNQHPAGSMVDVDAGTLAQLQADGIVGETEWVGPSGGGGGTDWVGPSGGANSWPGPTGEDPEWVGPSGEDPEWVGPSGEDPAGSGT